MAEQRALWTPANDGSQTPAGGLSQPGTSWAWHRAAANVCDSSQPLVTEVVHRVPSVSVIPGMCSEINLPTSSLKYVFKDDSFWVTWEGRVTHPNGRGSQRRRRQGCAGFCSRGRAGRQGCAAPSDPNSRLCGPTHEIGLTAARIHCEEAETTSHCLLHENGSILTSF